MATHINSDLNTMYNILQHITPKDQIKYNSLLQEIKNTREEYVTFSNRGTPIVNNEQYLVKYVSILGKFSELLDNNISTIDNKPRFYELTNKFKEDTVSRIGPFFTNNSENSAFDQKAIDTIKKIQHTNIYHPNILVKIIAFIILIYAVKTGYSYIKKLYGKMKNKFLELKDSF